MVDGLIGGRIGTVWATRPVDLGRAETRFRGGRVHAVGTWGVVVEVGRGGRELLLDSNGSGGKREARLARPSLLGVFEVKVVGSPVGTKRQRGSCGIRALYVGHDQAERERVPFS
jgi:hypothetical protein